MQGARKRYSAGRGDIAYSPRLVKVKGPSAG
jgi:hypothetical protein